MSPDDELRSLASASPASADVSPDLEARVRRLAHAELARAAQPAWIVFATRALTRVALPAAITVTMVGYLRWAVEAVSALHR